jgi:hypothetical protein
MADEETVVVKSEDDCLKKGQITNEITETKHKLYIIRRNEEEICLVKNETEAIYAIDSLVAQHIEKIQAIENTEAFRQDEEDGKVVKILTQSSSYFTSILKVRFIYDFKCKTVCDVIQRGSDKSCVPQTANVKKR